MTPRHTPRVNTSEGFGIFSDAEGVELPECRQHQRKICPEGVLSGVALRPAYTTMSRFHLYPLQSGCPQGGCPRGQWPPVPDRHILGPRTASDEQPFLDWL